MPRISEQYGRRVGSFDEIPVPPLAPLRMPLHEARVSVVTAGGVHLADDEPFERVVLARMQVVATGGQEINLVPSNFTPPSEPVEKK